MEFEIQFPSPKWRKDSQVGSGKYSQKKRLDIPQYKCYNIVYNEGKAIKPKLKKGRNHDRQLANSGIL